MSSHYERQVLADLDRLRARARHAPAHAVARAATRARRRISEDEWQGAIPAAKAKANAERLFTITPKQEH